GARNRNAERGLEAALHVGLDHGRVDVRAAAHGSRVTELSRHAVDRGDHVAFRLGFRLEAHGIAERARGEHGACPGAEVLGGEVFPRYIAQVIVDVVGSHAAMFAIDVDVLEQALTREVFTTLDHPGHAPVRDPDLDLDAALAREHEPHGGAPHVDVTAAQRGEPERFVLLRILLVADAGKRGLQEPDDGGYDLRFGQAVAPEVSRDAAPDPRQHSRKGGHPVELVGVADLAPAGVIFVLLAAAGIASRGLAVAARPRRDPHVLPGGRVDQRADAAERGCVADELAVWPVVMEAAALVVMYDP